MKFALPILVFSSFAILAILRQGELQAVQERSEKLSTAILEFQNTRVSSPSPQNRASRSQKRDQETSSTENGIPYLGNLSDGELREFMESNENSSMPDMRKYVAFQRFLFEASDEELINLIERTETLGLSPETYNSTLNELLSSLGRKDPQRALEASFSLRNFDSNQDFWSRGEVYSVWLTSNPSEAVEWLDAQIEQGTLEPKSLQGDSQARIEFESLATYTLLKTDFEAAKQRMMSLPPRQRMSMLTSGGQMAAEVVESSDLQNLARLVRDGLPENQQASTLASMAESMSWYGWEQIDSFIAQSEASIGESTLIARQVATNKLRALAWQNDGEPDTLELTKTRDFVARHAPSEQGAIMGQALGGYLRYDGENLAQTVSLVEAEFKRKADDQLLFHFLETTTDRFPENEEVQAATAQLIERIQDPVLRERLTEKD